MFPAESMAAPLNKFAVLEPTVAAPGGGAGFVGESITPLKTGWFVAANQEFRHEA